MAALADFHEPTHGLRELTHGLKRLVSRQTPAIRTAGVATLMSLFVAASGAFGAGGISPGLRYPLLTGIGLSLSITGLGLAQVTGRMEAFKTRPALRAAATALAGFVVATLFCWTIGRLFQGARTPGLLDFAGPSAVFMGAVAALDWLTRASTTAAKRPRGPADAFRARLPHRLRGAAILAVHGEDHYVRVHTSGGEHLVWMRLSDALEELAGLEGRQTHRSWWVARSAVTGVRRGNGRALLTLSNGLQAPVSRRFAASLREDDWY